MVISKLDAARIQLDCSIEHFFLDNHTCAVTLAGAAEDILGGLLKIARQQSPFEFLHDWYQTTYGIEITTKQFSREIANAARNWLKHSEEDSESPYNILEQDSILMLMRAVPCYWKLANMQTVQMERFTKFVRENPTKLNELFS